MDIYRKLQRHLDTSAVGYPKTESGVEIRLLKGIITPEEAEIAIHCSTTELEPAKKIYERMKDSEQDTIPLEELIKKLDRMAFKRKKTREVVPFDTKKDMFSAIMVRKQEMINKSEHLKRRVSYEKRDF